jgi:Family of unknown function (DUF6726)
MQKRPHIASAFARLLACFALGYVLASCGVVAAPCRIGSGAIKAVPLVGHIAATPTDACADVIDPDSISRS